MKHGTKYFVWNYVVSIVNQESMIFPAYFLMSSFHTFTPNIFDVVNKLQNISIDRSFHSLLNDPDMPHITAIS